MSQPHHRVAADGTIALSDVRPTGVLFEAEKYAQRALIRALGQHDFVTFVECRISRSSAYQDCGPPSFSIFLAALGHGRKFGLFSSLAFSNLVFAASASLARRAASR